jgi:hypothetical protein
MHGHMLVDKDLYNSLLFFRDLITVIIIFFAIVIALQPTAPSVQLSHCRPGGRFYLNTVSKSALFARAKKTETLHWKILQIQKFKQPYKPAGGS